MWLLGGGGAIVRRRKRVKLESRGSVPIVRHSDPTGGVGVYLSRGQTKGKMTIERSQVNTYSSTYTYTSLQFRYLLFVSYVCK